MKFDLHAVNLFNRALVGGVFRTVRCETPHAKGCAYWQWYGSQTWKVMLRTASECG